MAQHESPGAHAPALTLPDIATQSLTQVTAHVGAESELVLGFADAGAAVPELTGEEGVVAEGITPGTALVGDVSVVAAELVFDSELGGEQAASVSVAATVRDEIREGMRR